MSRLLTGSATRKPRLLGGDKGRNNKQTVSLPGSPALWAGCFQNARLRHFPHPSPFNVHQIQRTSKYTSRLRISGALHTDVFEQPVSVTF